MELVDIYNDKHEKLNYTKGRKELSDGEFRLSCFVWIINDKDELLIQQSSVKIRRTSRPTDLCYPNKALIKRRKGIYKKVATM